MITTIDLGGAEKQLLSLATEQVKLGHEVYVGYLKGSAELNDAFIEADVSVIDLSKHSSWLLQVRQLQCLLSDLNPQIVHGHLPRSELYLSLIRGRIPLIVTKHNSEAMWPRLPSHLVSRLLSRWIEYRSMRVICISQSVYGYLLDVGEVANSKKFSVIHYGINLRANQIEPPPSQNKSEFRVGTISRLVAQKDIPTLIKGFADFHEAFPNSSLAIVGEGELRELLVDMVKDINLEESIQFLGKTENVEEFLTGLDVFVLSSRYEGFGLVLLEAMSVGTPIIASNCDAICEVMGRGFHGLFAAGEYLALSELLKKAQNGTFLQVLKSYQEHRVKQFDIYQATVDTLLLYNSCKFAADGNI